jgi:hypothetical protein
LGSRIGRAEVEMAGGKVDMVAFGVVVFDVRVFL